MSYSNFSPTCGTSGSSTASHPGNVITLNKHCDADITATVFASPRLFLNPQHKERDRLFIVTYCTMVFIL